MNSSPTIVFFSALLLLGHAHLQAAPPRPNVVARLKARLLEINAGIMAEGADWHLP